MLISKNEAKKINKIGNNELSVVSYLQKNEIDEYCKNKTEIEKRDIGGKCKNFSKI